MKQTVCIAMAFGKKAAKEILDSINHYCQSSRPTVKQKGTDVFLSWNEEISDEPFVDSIMEMTKRYEQPEKEHDPDYAFKIMAVYWEEDDVNFAQAFNDAGFEKFPDFYITTQIHIPEESVEFAVVRTFSYPDGREEKSFLESPTGNSIMDHEMAMLVLQAEFDLLISCIKGKERENLQYKNTSTYASIHANECIMTLEVKAI